MRGGRAVGGEGHFFLNFFFGRRGGRGEGPLSVFAGASTSFYFCEVRPLLFIFAGCAHFLLLWRLAHFCFFGDWPTFFFCGWPTSSFFCGWPTFFFAGGPPFFLRPFFFRGATSFFFARGPLFFLREGPLFFAGGPTFFFCGRAHFFFFFAGGPTFFVREGPLLFWAGGPTSSFLCGRRGGGEGGEGAFFSLRGGGGERRFFFAGGREGAFFSLRGRGRGGPHFSLVGAILFSWFELSWRGVIGSRGDALSLSSCRETFGCALRALLVQTTPQPTCCTSQTTQGET